MHAFVEGKQIDGPATAETGRARAREKEARDALVFSFKRREMKRDDEREREQILPYSVAIREVERDGELQRGSETEITIVTSESE